MKKKNAEEKQNSALRDAQDAASAATKQNTEEQNLEHEFIEEADQEIEAIDDSKIELLENQLRRAVADYQNLEKRVAEQKSNWIMSANKDLILRLLPGLDNLLLADKHTQDEGVKIAIKHFMDTLEGDGVKKIKTENADFDPNLMEAVTTKTGEEGKVVEELKAGYTLNGEVIRPAQVIVGKASN